MLFFCNEFNGSYISISLASFSIHAGTTSTLKGYFIAEVNQLRGSIPVEIGSMTNLGKALGERCSLMLTLHDVVSLISDNVVFQPEYTERLLLNGNELTGIGLPSEIGQLTRLGEYQQGFVYLTCLSSF